MATPNLQVILQALFAVTDNLAPNAPQTAEINFQNPTLGATSVYYNPYFQASSGGSAIDLPATPSFLLAVQNLDAAINLAVGWTPTGQPAAVQILGPGDVLIVMNDSKASGSGYSNLILTAGSSTVSAIVLVGA